MPAFKKIFGRGKKSGSSKDVTSSPEKAVKTSSNHPEPVEECHLPTMGIAKWDEMEATTTTQQQQQQQPPTEPSCDQAEKEAGNLWLTAENSAAAATTASLVLDGAEAALTAEALPPNKEGEACNTAEQLNYQSIPHSDQEPTPEVTPTATHRSHHHHHHHHHVLDESLSSSPAASLQGSPERHKTGGKVKRYKTRTGDEATAACDEACSVAPPSEPPLVESKDETKEESTSAGSNKSHRRSTLPKMKSSGDTAETKVVEVQQDNASVKSSSREDLLKSSRYTLPSMVRLNTTVDETTTKTKHHHSRSKETKSSKAMPRPPTPNAPSSATRNSDEDGKKAMTTTTEERKSTMARPERTASLLGGWVKSNSRRNKGSCASSSATTVSSSSRSAVAVSGASSATSKSNGGSPPVDMMMRGGNRMASLTPSPRNVPQAIDVLQLCLELNKLQSEMQRLSEINLDTRSRHEADVAEMRQEVGSIVFEMGGLKVELERYRRDCEQLELSRKMEQTVGTKTDRSSLTLRCFDAAEVALTEQLQRMHDEGGPLVPFEGNKLLLPSSILSRRTDDVKVVWWGDRVGRRVSRTVVMVMTGLRQLWYFYLTMYPIM